VGAVGEGERKAEDEEGPADEAKEEEDVLDVGGRVDQV